VFGRGGVFWGESSGCILLRSGFSGTVLKSDAETWRFRSDISSVPFIHILTSIPTFII
jgi:hypothetical protein